MNQHLDPYIASPSSNDEGRILIVTAVEAEKNAVMRGLAEIGGIDVIAAGVGSAAAAAGTATALAEAGRKYRLVISAGIGGGFVGQAEISTLVVADAIIAADLGAETQDGFLGLDELGFGSARAEVNAEWSNRVFDAIFSAGLEVVNGPVLTVATTTGSAETARKLAERVPGAAAEAMEGHGVAVAAHARNIPVIEIRAISNAVGPRNREAWKIGEALSALEKACHVVKEVLQ